MVSKLMVPLVLKLTSEPGVSYLSVNILVILCYLSKINDRLDLNWFDYCLKPNNKEGLTISRIKAAATILESKCKVSVSKLNLLLC